jgi:hypothetical protein
MTRTVRMLRAMLLVSVGVASPACAHVGSPDTWFEGMAGRYPIRVVVRAPGVVPGLAEISVRVLAGHPSRVTAQPFAWNAGEHGAPPPDVAKPVPGDPQLYSVSLWFMVTTSYGVHVSVSGAEGTGMAIVPVQAVPTRRLPLEGPLRTVLIALGLFLCAGFLTLVGAALREGSLPPGAQAARADRHRARIGVLVAGLVLFAALAGGYRWWRNVDRAFAGEMFQPFHVRTTVSDEPRWLRLDIDDERWHGRRWSPLIPDHGKLMHLFLVRDGGRNAGMNAFAHLHPLLPGLVDAPIDSSYFECSLPPLPPGMYRVYADIVHESGFAQTLSDSVRIRKPESLPPAAPPAWAPTDGDDSWFVGGAAAETSGDVRCPLGDGCTLVWERGTAPLVERALAPLRFRVLAPDGSPARLEPFLGMAGHAVLRSDDGAVFAHLHPTGSVAMASQMALEMRTPADSVSGTLGRRLSVAGGGMPAMPGMTQGADARHVPGGTLRTGGDLPGEFAIPYGFPRPGHYRMWVQVKHAGHVQTAAFDLTVRAAKPV